jgi:hypothetical protein
LNAGQTAWLALLPDVQARAEPWRQALQVPQRALALPEALRACGQVQLRRHWPLQAMDAIAGQGDVPCR